jgi:signal transduction histidine kinase
MRARHAFTRDVVLFMIVRFLLALAALAAVLIALLGSGMLTDRQMAGAEQALMLRQQQQMMLLQSQVYSVQEYAAAQRAYLARDTSAHATALSLSTDLDGLLAEYQTRFPQGGAANYKQLTDQFNSAVTRLLQASDTGDQGAARNAAQALDSVAESLANTQHSLVSQSDTDRKAAQQTVDNTRAQVVTQRMIATILGLALVVLLVVINLVYQGRPLAALARQTRRALRSPAQDMPEFVLDPTAPRTAKELTSNLNNLVAQLREKYIELERANAGLHELNEEARSASQAKTAFVASISHELRTPLNTILGFSEMLLAEMYGPLTPRQRIQLERILRNGQQLLTLINDVLDISRVEAGKVSLNLERIDVTQMIGGVVTTMDPLAKQKGLAFRVEMPPNLPPIVSDENRLRQILLNLLSNAVKFTKQGSVTLWIGFDPLLPNWLLFRVRDTGIGIPAGELDRIWQEFYQVSHGLSRTAGGSGLGLAIVRKLVELLGGDIDVKSTEGEGSTFTVYIPLQPSETRDGSAGASLYAATGSYTAPRKK